MSLIYWTILLCSIGETVTWFTFRIVVVSVCTGCAIIGASKRLFALALARLGGAIARVAGIVVALTR
jgi:hypothetical protein